MEVTWIDNTGPWDPFYVMPWYRPLHPFATTFHRAHVQPSPNGSTSREGLQIITCLGWKWLEPIWRSLEPKCSCLVMSIPSAAVEFCWSCVKHRHSMCSCLRKLCGFSQHTCTHHHHLSTMYRVPKFSPNHQATKCRSHTLENISRILVDQT